MGLGGGGKRRAFAVVAALLLARCTLSPRPEDPGLTPGGADKGTHGSNADAGISINGSAGTTAEPGTSGSGGYSGSGYRPPVINGADAAADASTTRDGGHDSGVNGDADATAAH